MFRLRPPQAGEGPALTALCLASKAHWGYDPAFMAACAAELTVHPGAGPQAVAEAADGPAGLAEITVHGRRAWLEKLFVAPGSMGRGAGRLLWDWALAEARAGGCRVLVVEADPGALPFYLRMGARRAGSVPSGSIPGRSLPRLIARTRG